MSALPQAGAGGRGTDARNRRLLIVIAAIAIAPVVISYIAYYALPRDARSNYGTLLATRPLAPIQGVLAGGAPFSTDDLRGRWVMLVAGSGECAGGCRDALYASRQARTIQNAERDRIRRVWLVTDDRPPAPEVMAGHEDLVVARVLRSAVADLPAGIDRIYLIDPLGNYVLAWPMQPDIKAVARDITRLLRASRIG
jgi:hypothetical protein